MRDLIALMMPAGPAFVDQLRSAWEHGDAVLPLDPNAPKVHSDAVLTAMRPAALVDGSGNRQALEGGVPIEGGDALVVLTSGTTGEPKGAIHTHRGIGYAAFMTSTAAHVDADSCWLACLPLFHVGGLSVVTRALHSGTALMVHSRFDAADVDQAAVDGATHVSLVPTVLARIDPKPWRTILLGGSAIPDDRPPNSIATYGMTETFGGVAYDGLPLNGVEVRCTRSKAANPDEDDEMVIEVRSPTLLRAYRSADDPHGTSAKTSDGWYRTGDIGQIDPDAGILTVHGRRDDLIITGGEKVWPKDVERIIAEDPRVLECAVVGRPDPEWGQAVVAIVAPRNSVITPSLADLRLLVKQHLPTAAAPKQLVLVNALERTALGKIRRAMPAGGQSEHHNHE